MRRLVHAAACRTSSLALLASAEELEEQAANRGVLAMLAARLEATAAEVVLPIQSQHDRCQTSGAWRTQYAAKKPRVRVL